MEMINSLTIVIPVKADGRDISRLGDFIERIHVRTIVVQDGTHPKTNFELESFVESKSDHITLIRGIFGSPGFSRNAGLDAANTNFVMFFDSDDVYPSNDVIDQFFHAAKTGLADISAGQYHVMHCLKNESQLVEVPNRFEDLLLDNVGIWRMIFRLDFIRSHDLRFEPTLMGEDLLFLLDCLALRPRFSASSFPVYTYIMGDPSQATNSTRARDNYSLLLDGLAFRYYSVSKPIDNILVARIWLKTIIYCLIKGNLALRRKMSSHFFHSLCHNTRLVLHSLSEVSWLVSRKWRSTKANSMEF